MNAIADSSSLIVLARQDALWLLERVFGPVALTPDVETETVIRGRAKGYADAKRIAQTIATKNRVRIEPTSDERRTAATLGRTTNSLSRADCITLACAQAHGLTLVMEEQRGRNIAIARGIT